MLTPCTRSGHPLQSAYLIYDPRHDGGVGHAQAHKAVHAELWVDDRMFIHAHFACANGMSEARRPKPGKFPDLLGGRLGAGHDFGLAHSVEGVLISKFTRGFDGAQDGRKIVIRAEIVAIDREALTQSKGRVSGPFGAADRLGIPSSTLESKIKALKIDKRVFKPQLWPVAPLAPVFSRG